MRAKLHVTEPTFVELVNDQDGSTILCVHVSPTKRPLIWLRRGHHRAAVVMPSGQGDELALTEERGGHKHNIQSITVAVAPPTG